MGAGLERRENRIGRCDLLRIGNNLVVDRQKSLGCSIERDWAFFRHGQIDATHVLPVRARIEHQDVFAAGRVVNDDRRGVGVVRVPAHDEVDARDIGRHLIVFAGLGLLRIVDAGVR